MAATRMIEEERGAYVGHMHAHNGYYAGDFSRRDGRMPTMTNTHPAASTAARPLVDLPSRRSARR